MTQPDRITKMIFDSIDEINEQLPDGDKVEKTLDAVLYARHGKLDSLKLVELVVAVEQRIEEEFDVAITLADERAVSQTRSPFATVGSFAQYIASRLESQSHPDEN